MSRCFLCIRSICRRPPTLIGFPVSSGQHPDSSGGSTALCHPQSLPVSPASSWELTPFSWSVCPGHVHLVLVHKHKTFSVSDLGFYACLWSLITVALALSVPSGLTSEVSRFLPYSVTLIRFTASILITLIQKCPCPLIIWSLSSFPSLNDASVTQVPLPCSEMGISLEVKD